MTISEINSFITLRTGADTNAFSAANRLISTNRWYEKVITMILKAVDGWDFDDSNKTDFPIATTSLVANQQDYSLPTNLLKIKRVEVTYDGTNWYKAEPFDINETGNATSSALIASNFTTSKPYYDIQGRSVLLYPIPTANSANGLKIWYVREPAEFTSAEVTTGTKEPGFDEAFHSMIPLGVCYDWFVAKDDKRAVLTWQELQDYETRLTQYYGSKDQDRNVVLKPAYISYE